MDMATFQKAVYGQTDDRPQAAGQVRPCRRCGNCCSAQVPLLYGEKRRIRRYIEANHITRSDSPGCPFLAHTVSGTCRCTVYPVRPMACRAYRCSRSSCDTEAIWAQLLTEGELTDMVEAFYPDRPPLGIYRRAHV